MAEISSRLALFFYFGPSFRHDCFCRFIKTLGKASSKASISILKIFLSNRKKNRGFFWQISKLEWELKNFLDLRHSFWYAWTNVDRTRLNKKVFSLRIRNLHGKFSGLTFRGVQTRFQIRVISEISLAIQPEKKWLNILYFKASFQVWSHLMRIIFVKFLQKTHFLNFKPYYFLDFFIVFVAMSRIFNQFYSIIQYFRWLASYLRWKMYIFQFLTIL